MKRLLSLFLAVLIAALLTACAAKGGADSISVETNSAGGADDMMNVGESFDSGAFDADLPMAPEEAPAPAPEPNGTGAGGRKVIYTADIQMETTDFDAASEALSRAVEASSGYFEERSVSNYDSGRFGSYTVRVPAAQFEAFCAQMGEICHVTDLRAGEQNVSEDYYDIEARLTTQRTKLERLQKLLSEADNMADIITIESAISDTELQIEYLTGSLRHYDALIDYATITVHMREVYRLSAGTEPPQSFGGRIIGALHSGLNGAVAAFEELVVLIAYGWVLLLLLLAAGAVLLLRWRRKKRSQIEETAQAEEKP